MSNPSINIPLTAASKDQLELMLAQAETYLNIQINVGMAADQRALVFAGFIAGAAVAVGGGATTLLVIGKHLFLGYLGFAAVIGLLFSLGLSIHAARPVPFEYAGNSPSEWLADVAAGKTIEQSMREQASHYAGMIDRNNETLSKNCKYLRWSQLVALWTLSIGGLIVMVYFVVGDLGIIPDATAPRISNDQI